MLTSDGFLDDFVRLFRPDEWFGVPIPVSDVVLDVSHESRDGVEGAAADRPPGEHTEPGLDHVHPGLLSVAVYMKFDELYSSHWSCSLAIIYPIG